MRLAVSVLVLCAMTPGCAHDRPPEGPAGPPAASSAPPPPPPAPIVSSAPTPPPPDPPAPPARSLRQRLDDYDKQWNATDSRGDADAVTARFVAELAADRSISDSEIRDAVAANTHDVAKLHEGPVRTYPDRRTMHELMGIASALKDALQARGAK